jgi:hypothetical protein
MLVEGTVEVKTNDWKLSVSVSVSAEISVSVSAKISVSAIFVIFGISRHFGLSPYRNFGSFMTISIDFLIKFSMKS